MFAAHNETSLTRSPLAHAEIICMERAARALGAWRLIDCTMFVTVEPCPMCAGAILTGRLQRLVYGARQPRIGADGSWISMFPGSQENELELCGSPQQGDSDGTIQNKRIRPVGPHPFHPGMLITRGVMPDECAEVLQTFFRRRRSLAKDMIDREINSSNL